MAGLGSAASESVRIVGHDRSSLLLAQAELLLDAAASSQKETGERGLEGLCSRIVRSRTSDAMPAAAAPLETRAAYRRAVSISSST